MIEIVRQEVVVRHKRKLGGLRRNGRGGSARKMKRAYVFCTWRMQWHSDHSYTLYLEYK